ncbi:MAG: hypothetical protein J0I59_13145 [Comamonas sp.]|nr:hypothetical protein [Comamonas sp.]
MVMRPASAAVAGEVRALAQRSSDAAKEIGVLIRAMVDGILQGADCMSQAGKTIDETVQAIRGLRCREPQSCHCGRSGCAACVRCGAFTFSVVSVPAPA